jgi:hypothetical protein
LANEEPHGRQEIAAPSRAARQSPESRLAGAAPLDMRYAFRKAKVRMTQRYVTSCANAAILRNMAVLVHACYGDRIGRFIRIRAAPPDGFGRCQHTLNGEGLHTGRALVFCCDILMVS